MRGLRHADLAAKQLKIYPPDPFFIFQVPEIGRSYYSNWTPHLHCRTLTNIYNHVEAIYHGYMPS